MNRFDLDPRQTAHFFAEADEYAPRMAETERLLVRINFGPNAHLTAFTHLVEDLDAVGRFAVALQRAADRNEAVYRVGRGRYLEEDFDVTSPYMLLSRGIAWPGVVSPRYEAAIGEMLAGLEQEENASVRLERVSYSNPAEFVILAAGAVTIAVLKFIRDWPQRRRLNELAVSEYESQVEARRELRKFVVQELTSGQHRLRVDQVDELLSADVEEALLALGDAEIQMLAQSESVEDQS